MSIETWELWNRDQGQTQPSQAERPRCPEAFVTERGTFQIQVARIEHGPGAGVDLITVRGPRGGATVIPTRGMGLWKAWADEHEFGWKSPIPGPVHPDRVPVWDPSGLGWLEGFDELLVRCGLESNGAPEFDDQGRVRWPLHGRVANLPAHTVTVRGDRSAGWLEVTGVVRESRLFFANFELVSTVRFYADRPVLEITDRVTNLRAQTAGHQLLYHINVGQPHVDAGSKLLVSADRVVPRNAHAATDIQRWSEYTGPTLGYAEQVYFFQPRAVEAHWARAALVNAMGSAALGVEYDTRTLPYFIQWKNTAAVEDGYVTGLEPATNFPNPRSFEEAQGRVVKLEGGAAVEHHLRLHLLTQRDEVECFTADLTDQLPTATEPERDWCA